jgi:hypothetical protein
VATEARSSADIRLGAPRTSSTSAGSALSKMRSARPSASLAWLASLNSPRCAVKNGTNSLRLVLGATLRRAERVHAQLQRRSHTNFVQKSRRHGNQFGIFTSSTLARQRFDAQAE